MRCGLRLFRLFSIAVLFWMTTSFLASTRADDVKGTLATIEKTLLSARKVVDNDLTQEKDLRAAQGQLKKLLESTDEQISEIGGEENPEHPLVIAHSKILAVLATIEARLPHEADATVTTRLSPLPVPQYSDHKVVGKAANELTEAQQKLAEQLSKAPGDKAGVEKLLTDVILARENLAWEVGWPFTAKEAAIVKKAGKLTPDAYLSRRNRGVERINEHLQKDLQSVGRETSGKSFAIYSPLSSSHQKQIEQMLVKQRGDAVKAAWTKGTQKFDAKAFGQTGKTK
jgi:hypothetical protein